MTERWHTVMYSPDAYFIQRDDIVVGSIAAHGDRWHVEVLWAGPGGDIKGEFASHEMALAFVEGVEKTLRIFFEKDETPRTIRGGDYTYEGYIIQTFVKRRGGTRYVVEDDNGRLFIHNAQQVGL